ncbi:MAG: type II toxin-antitoxin system VapC family toxin [Nitrospirota bacterium]|nr:type II toxin-antitoxin system VapC family toxin [Nitrospirota bacterium]
MHFVLDASVALSWCFPDEAGTYTDKVLKFLTNADNPAVAHVPAIWPLEVGNALLAGERRNRLTEAQTIQLVDYFDSLDIVVDEAGKQKGLGVTLALAREHGLSTYDASYLELAIRKALPLATQDKKLKTVAQKCGVPLVK